MQNLQCISLQDMSTVSIPKSAILCLGNFDGVHLAHQALIRRAKEFRDLHSKDSVCGVFCFREPSWKVLLCDPPEQLCTLEQKLNAFRAAGAEYAYLADFPSLSHLSPNEFLQQILVNGCHAIGAVCGFNYRFGNKGAGTPKDLLRFFGKNAIVEREILQNGQPVSSTRIRNLLKEGNIETANHLLGRHYSFTAKVVHGKALGKKLGAPTVNQSFPNEQLIPHRGVYVTKCSFNGFTYRGVSNVGIHPTVDTNAPINCETYLLDFEGDLYDKELTVEFLHFIRPEQHFSSKEELIKQIGIDIQIAHAFREKETNR